MIGGNARGTVAAANYVTAAITPDGTFGGAYLPTTTTISVNMALFSAPVTAEWVDPSSGAVNVIQGSPFANTVAQVFTTPGMTSDGQTD